MQDFDDLPRGGPIAEGVRLTLAGNRGGVDRLDRARDKPISFNADELGPARLDGFGALSDFAHNQDMLAERGGFFLDSARVAEDEGAVLHQPDEGNVVYRRQKMNPREAVEQLPDRSLHAGAKVDRKNEVEIRERCDQVADCPANAAQGAAMVLAAVRR